jgi:hypothetical protein
MPRKFIKPPPAPAFLLLAFLFVYLHVFMLPFTPVAAWGDQSLFLLEARHMLEGRSIYRDFFEFNSPGIDVVYWSLFRLFGVRAWIPDFMLVLLGVSMAWLTLVISRKLINGPSAYLPALLFLTFPFRSMLDGTHHWYSTLAVTAALAVVIERRDRWRLAAAGALCGLAAWFTSTRGPAALLGFAAFLFWERRQRADTWRLLIGRLAYLLGGFLAAVLMFYAWFVWRAGLRRFLECTVVYTVKYFPAEPYNNWRAYMSGMPHINPWFKPLDILVWLFIHGLLPLVYVLFFVRNWREADPGRREPRASLTLVSGVGLCLFLGIAPSPGFYRLCSVAGPALIVLIWFVRCPGRVERALLTLLWAGSLILLIAEPVIRQNHWRAYFDLPTGRTAYLDLASYEQFRWVSEQARPSDYLFGNTLMCFALCLGDPAQVPYVTTSEYTRPEQVQKVVNGLERHRVRFITWYPSLNLPGSTGHDNLEPLRAYVRSHYHVAKTFASSEIILERNEPGNRS